jgi:N-methylhydantoinase A
MPYTISVDTGGTFTDVVISDPTDKLTIGKALTTRDRIFLGVHEAIQAAADEINVTLSALLSQTKLLIYGTTRATNAIVTKTVAKTAFVTTEGFADILVLKEGGKFNPHDFSKDYSDPYVPRRYTYEIPERMSAEGTISVPFQESRAREVAQVLKAKGFEAVAVCFLWSIANPEHEIRMARLLDEILPSTPYTLSHQLIPIVREYRRASATAIDASLKPLMQQHLRELETDLRQAGFSGEVLVSTTAGGCAAIEALVEKPIYTVGSGPAMAPIAGLTFSRLEGLGDNIIVCDTGGTTFDVGLVRDGHLTYTRETWLGQQYTGNLLGISAVDMRSIGAGGGSIAWIDDGGLMRVGPQSAGADPGPACYGRGGKLPTVSDAACVLGYFDPEFFLGGRMKLDPDAAHRAVSEIAATVALSPEETAYRIIGLASDFMMRAIGDITINEGVNPRESTIVAGGGAAGLNIMMIAKELGCDRVVLPKVAAALSASGMQFANIVSEESASMVTLSSRFDTDRVNALLDDLTSKLEVVRRGLGERAAQYRVDYFAEARYLSQVWELDTPLPGRRFDGAADLAAFVETFHQVHERMFDVRDVGSPVEIVNWKARLIVPLASPPAIVVGPETGAVVTAKVSRPCFFGSSQPVATGVFRPGDIPAGGMVAGPSIIEEPTTTIVVYPGMSATLTPAGNYLLNVA